MNEKIKNRIIEALEKSGLSGLTISEVAHRARTTRITAAEYLRVLTDQKIVVAIPKPPLRLHVLKKFLEDPHEP
jgi:DNA-binding IclR family transcriptional regulator